MKLLQTSPRWEYKIAYADVSDLKSLESRMNRKGKVRWELVATIPERDNDFRLIFKRPI